MKSHFIIKCIMFLVLLIIQYYALEEFEKFYYLFEERYTVGMARAKNNHLINVFNPAMYRLTYPKDELPLAEGEHDIAPFYNEDEYGFRTWNIDYDVKKGKRFLFVGSFSMGYGWGVPVEKNFPSVFSKELGKLNPSIPFEVINANRGSLSLSATFHQLKDDLFTRIKPDVVVLGTYRPSYPRNNGKSLEERVFGDNRKDIQEVSVQEKNMIIVSKMKHSDLWNTLYVKSRLMGKLLTYLDLKLYETICPDDKCGREDTDYAGYLYDLHEYLSQHNIPLLVVELVEQKNRASHKIDIINKHVRDVCDELGVPYLSINELRPIWSYTWVAQSHYSIQSNQLIGTDIATWANEILDDNFKLAVKTPIKSSSNIKTSLIFHPSMKSEK